MIETAYSLRLGDGSCWLIIATPGTTSWVEKFARIMRLKTHEGDRHTNRSRIFFFSNNSGKEVNLEPIHLIGSIAEEELPKRGWEAHDLQFLRFWAHREVPDILCELGNEVNQDLDIIRMWTSLYIIFLRVQDLGGLPIHAALIERDGRGVLLAGPGGSGKSTSCSRLPHFWHALSEDQALIVRDDIKSYLAHPCPTWSDYFCQRPQRRWHVERLVPLGAIFFLEQAESDEVIPISQEQAAVFINYSSTEVRRTISWDLSDEAERELRVEIFENSCQLARAIPAYIFRISLSGRFWELMEKVL